MELSAGEALSFALQLHESGFPDEAETLYRRILDRFPDYPDALHFLGLLCHESGRHVEAVELLERIAAMFPENADAHNSLGIALAALERHAESEACYRKAIALDPGHAHAYNNLGVTFTAQDRHLEAVEVYRKAVDLQPDRVDFRCNMGRALRRAGLKVEAISVFADAVVLDPENVGTWQELALTLILKDLEDPRDEVVPSSSKLSRLLPSAPLARYWQAACLGRNAPSAAPPLFIEDTFDKLAKGFDKLLTVHLDYRAPDLVVEALAAVLPEPARSLDILDAGCGTGLCGPLLRDYAKSLTGVDLSSKMIELARERKTYDFLIKAEISEYFRSNPATWDLIVSADTLCYFGSLETVFENAFDALREGGFFVFTLEDAKHRAVDWRLNPNARYSHESTYVESALGDAGFILTGIRSVVLRKEGNAPVRGHLVTAWKKPLV
ncbi:MAG TPA: tetratricopeptide repeat protein [Syntrophobacteraceae bacterium]|nr:tetratricopeptide repeat protein [Syntrophobacteraceae bacterium]